MNEFPPNEYFYCALDLDERTFFGDPRSIDKLQSASIFSLNYPIVRRFRFHVMCESAPRWGLSSHRSGQAQSIQLTK